MRETLNDATQKRSALETASLAFALLAVLCVVVLSALLYTTHGDTFFHILLGGGLLSFFITSTGVIIGSIVLYGRGIRIGWAGLAGLMASVVSLAFSVFLVLVGCFVYLFKDIPLMGFH